MNQRDCFVSEEELNIYLDGELAEVRKAELDSHLPLCGDCSMRFEIAASIESLIRESAGSEKAPAWLRDRILAGIAKENQARIGGFWGFLIDLVRMRPLIPIGAAAVLILFLFFGVFSRLANRGTMPLVTAMIHEHYEYIEEKPAFGIQSDNIEEISRWITANSGIACELPSNDKMPSPTGGCVIEDDGKTIGYVSFAYLDKQVSLFMIADGGKGLFGSRLISLGRVSAYCGRCTGMNYVLWRGGSATCVLVGDLPEKSLVELADLMI